MNPRLIELLREYWILTAEFDHSVDQAGQQRGASIRMVEDEIGKIAIVENRCSFCLADLADADPAKIRDGICGKCIAEETR